MSKIYHEIASDCPNPVYMWGDYSLDLAEANADWLGEILQDTANMLFRHLRTYKQGFPVKEVSDPAYKVDDISIVLSPVYFKRVIRESMLKTPNDNISQSFEAGVEVHSSIRGQDDQPDQLGLVGNVDATFPPHRLTGVSLARTDGSMKELGDEDTRESFLFDPEAQNFIAIIHRYLIQL